MKKLFLLLLTGLWILAGCSSEEELTPSGFENLSRFQFPENDGPADELFYEIWRNAGPTIIYQAWTDADFNRTWVGSSAISFSYRADYFSAGQTDLLKCAEWLNDRVFTPISGELAKKTFPQYIYLPKDFRLGMARERSLYYLYYYATLGDLFDFWIVSPDETVWNYESLDSARFLSSHLILHFFEQAYNRAHLDIPAAFESGMDYQSGTLSYYPYDSDKDNYFKKLGFAEYCYMRSGATNEALGEFYGQASGAAYVRGKRDFIAYISSMLYYLDFDGHYADYPFIIERKNVLKAWLLEEHGIDMDLITQTVHCVDLLPG
ncbi:MAG: hypothetical protein LUD68_05760 [Rikenellaceae bacterium]|nr:hypothetical protein [Rikenellaceae bacterium]